MSFKSTLTALRTTLGAVAPAYLQDALPLTSTGEIEPPTDNQHIIISVIPSAPTTMLDASVYEDLMVQVGCWDDDSMAAAVDLQESVRAALKLVQYQRTGGVHLDRDKEFRGCIATYTLVAAFEEFST